MVAKTSHCKASSALTSITDAPRTLRYGERRQTPCPPHTSGTHPVSSSPGSRGEGRVRGSHKGRRCQSGRPLKRTGAFERPLNSARTIRREWSPDRAWRTARAIAPSLGWLGGRLRGRDRGGRESHQITSLYIDRRVVRTFAAMTISTQCGLGGLRSWSATTRRDVTRASSCKRQ